MVKGTTTKKRTKKDDGSEESEDDGQDVAKMTVAQLKEELSNRGLITKGLKADLVKRLSARLQKEKNPQYKPRGPEKIRHCAWCGEVMVKKVKPRSDRIDRFYACPKFPDCTYSESMSGHSKKKKITSEEERTKASDRAKALGTAMQSWTRAKWADYNSKK